jgi:hypothetical protein
VENYKVECVALISTSRGIFKCVQRWVTDLVKSVICQVVAGRPWSSASTDLQLGIPLYHLLESVTVKPTCKRLHGGDDRPVGVAPSFKAKTECIPLCVPGSSFTHKATSSEINSITSVYYIISYYKNLLQVQN